MTISVPRPWSTVGRGLPQPELEARATAPEASASVGVVVTTYNQALFLAHALESVGMQTRAADAVVVIDDGSTDDAEAVASRFPAVRFIRQENRGLAAARNRGLREIDTTFVVFLDADDLLGREAICAGLACFARVPDSGFVYGGHRYIDADGREIGERFEPPGDSPYTHLLRGNFIAMHGTVMYRRDLLSAVGGFDEGLRRCEDYDVYLRMAYRYPVTGYPDLVASYRLHGANMSADHRTMLRTALEVHRRYRPHASEGSALKAWTEGRRRWRVGYAEAMAATRYRERQQGRALTASLPALAHIATAEPRVAVIEALGGIRRRVAAVLPERLRARLLRGRERVPPVGAVRFGHLHRATPISDCFGFDRGLPVDRYYIERFLARHSSEIVGRVLEIGDDGYTRKFGGSRVSRSDVLHVSSGNPRATLVGDLTTPHVLPANAFDCIVLTQTLQLIYDVPRAIDQLHQALAPGGVVLVTAPGISQLDRGEWRDTWYWSFTPRAFQRLFAEVFGAAAVMVEGYGNVFAATAFLQGLAVEELKTSDLDPIDASYPVIVAVRARKRL